MEKGKGLAVGPEKDPQPVAKWKGMRKATEFGARCMQGRVFGEVPAAEKCRAIVLHPGSISSPSSWVVCNTS
jgi:hypothetical protein